MEKSSVLTSATWVLIILGILMIYLGGIYVPQVMYPPIVTGIGFFVIAWVFNNLKE